MAHFKMIDTPLEEIPKLNTELHEAFRSRITFPVAYRQHQLLQMCRMLQENHKLIAEAIYADLGKPNFEVYLLEINTILGRALTSAKQLPEWAGPQSLEDHPDLPPWQKSWKPKVTKTPKGAVLVIAPWNYPLTLALQGAIGAVAAGCTVCVKLSEVTPHFAGLFQEYLIPKYMDPRTFRVVCGAVPEITKVLEQKWDHIFYTGNGTVARIVAAAAAKHLTPLTLELGGKSPVLIDPDCNIQLAAKRTFWGKCLNEGQVCVSPDYVLLPSGTLEPFMKGVKEAYASFFPDGALKSDSYAKMVNPGHFHRMKRLMERSKGKVLLGGAVDEAERRIEPTVVLVKAGDALLESENFGPVLVLVEVEDMKAACDWVNAGDHPLVIYLFSENEKIQQEVRKLTMSGTLVMNDTFMQLDVAVIPFGGVGESGYGQQNLRHTFDCFSYDRSSVDIPSEAEDFLALRYPPYSQQAFDIMCTPALNVELPSSTPEDGLIVKS